jgi:MoaA/NifB/PqqE/SkfB family radical SAM enzyme
MVVTAPLSYLDSVITMEKFLSIHLTDMCNSACTFCVVSSPQMKSDRVRYEDIVNFLEANTGGGYEIVNLHGGEPTVHPRFIEIVELVRRLGFREIHLQTNALRLADASFTAKLVQSGVAKFIVSLHGETPDIHDSQTGVPGGFLRTVRGIRNARAQGAHVRTNTVVTRQNLEHLSEICRFACELGVNHINMSNVHPEGLARFVAATVIPTFEMVRQPLYNAVDVVESYGRQITLEGFPYCVIRARMGRHLSETRRDIRMLVYGRVISDYDRFMCEAERVVGDCCADCMVKEKCGGVYPPYVEHHGWNELSPILECVA